jgi:hypothetical protein
MLSGFWGYPPVDLTFVSKQLGHSDVRTTQRFYGHWDPGAGVVMARVLRGEQQDLVEPVTANRLLGHKGRTSGKTRSPLCSPLSANSSKNLGKSLIWVNDGDSPNWGFSPGFLNEVDYRVVHETAGRLALAIVGNLDATEEAVAFLKSLGAHPAALRALALVVEGDARGIRQAIDLAGQVTASTERSQSSATAP